MSKILHVAVEISGQPVPVGTIEGNSSSDAVFSYAPSYLERPHSAPVSISLPLQEEPFSAGRTANFFEGLLPEGFMRRSVAISLHKEEQDYLDILEQLGSECLGALRIYSENGQQEPSYTPLSPEEVRKLAEEGTEHSVEIVVKTHLSLTGASGKVGLYYDKSGGGWYLPVGTAPSTHILKQSHVRLRRIVANEQLSLRTAANLGLDVPQSFIVHTGDKKNAYGEDEVLLATQRFDRVFREDAATVSGLPVPCRLHQEDFAQAMGIPGSKKYETEPDHYLAKMFEMLRRHSAEPLTDMKKLWQGIVVNYLLGNTDCHLKNYSLLYSPDLHSMRLAPFYDMVSTCVYESSTRENALYIGEDHSLDTITRSSFEAAAAEAGMGRRAAMKEFDDLTGAFEKALRSATEEVAGLGFPDADEISDAILKRGGYANL